MTKIAQEVQDEVNQIIARFNKMTFPGTDQFYYFARFKGSFIYINRQEEHFDTPIARLKYNGDLKTLDFAIYKWSTESYSANEFMFPGWNLVNGTVEGALHAGMEAYPPEYNPELHTSRPSFFSRLLKFFN
jgi:hypothetical protein